MIKNILSCFLFLISCLYGAEQNVPLKVIVSKNESNFKEKAEQIMQLENLAGSNLNLKYLKFINKAAINSFYIVLKKGDQKKVIYLKGNLPFSLFGYKNIELLTNADTFKVTNQFIDVNCSNDITIEDDTAVYEIVLNSYIFPTGVNTVKAGVNIVKVKI